MPTQSRPRATVRAGVLAALRSRHPWRHRFRRHDSRLPVTHARRQVHTAQGRSVRRPIRASYLHVRLVHEQHHLPERPGYASRRHSERCQCTIPGRFDVQLFRAHERHEPVRRRDWSFLRYRVDNARPPWTAEPRVDREDVRQIEELSASSDFAKPTQRAGLYG